MVRKILHNIVLSAIACTVASLPFYAQTASAQDVTLYEAEHLLRDLGGIVEDANATGGQAVYAAKGNRGFIAYGPFESIAKTNAYYEVRFSIKVDDNSQYNNVALLDVTLDEAILGNKAVLATHFDVVDTYQNVSVFVHTKDANRLQYRVQTLGTTDVTLDNIALYEVDRETYVQHINQTSTRKDVMQTYEAEGLFRSIGSVVADNAASNGLAVQSSEGSTGFLAFGPYTTERIATNKTYNAIFTLKLDTSSETDDAIAIIDVHNADTDTPIVRRVLTTADFSNADGYQEFAVEFASPDVGQLEYRVEVLSQTIQVSFDNIEVTEQ